MRRYLRPVVLAIAFLTATTAFSQGVQTATLQGTVTTSDGNRLPGVTVTVTSPALMGERQAVTGETGAKSARAGNSMRERDVRQIEWPTVARNQVRKRVQPSDCTDEFGCTENLDPGSGDTGGAGACARKMECASDRCTSSELTQVTASCRWIIIGSAWSCATC